MTEFQQCDSCDESVADRVRIGARDYCTACAHILIGRIETLRRLTAQRAAETVAA